MFDWCFNDKSYNQAIGIAIEARRLEIAKKAIIESGEIWEKLNYAYEISSELIDSKEYRKDILKMLVEIYESQTQQDLDYYNLSKCQFFLDEPESTSILLSRLLESEEGQLIAF